MLGRERARYFISTNYKDEHAGNCAIAVGFKGATRVSWSVIIVAPLPHARAVRALVHTSPPAAVVAAAGGGKKKRSIMSSRSGIIRISVILLNPLIYSFPFS